MIAFDAEAHGRRGRIFTRDGLQPSRESLDRIFADSFTNEDVNRVEDLHSALSRPVLFAVAHQGVDPGDVMHVYIRNTEPAIFACVVVTTARLRQMLSEAPTVLENLDLQVAPTERLTVPAIEAAMQAWVERNFPRLPVPQLIVEPWVDPANTELVKWLVDVEPSQFLEPVTTEPNMAVAEPPLESAA